MTLPFRCRSLWPMKPKIQARRQSGFSRQPIERGDRNGHGTRGHGQSGRRSGLTGLFARVRLQAEGSKPALLIHEQAVLTDQDRKYVYVLGEGNAAQRRDVLLGAEINGLRVAESGLQPGSKVIVNGTHQDILPGQTVAPVSVPMEAPNSAAAQAAAPDAASAPEA